VVRIRQREADLSASYCDFRFFAVIATAVVKYYANLSVSVAKEK
jgi:hypothetical protein